MCKIVIKQVLLFLCLLLSQISFSKTEYIPGYIIDLHKDTIYGQIKYEDWYFNSDKIYFKQNKKFSASTFKPSDIAGFGIGEKRFVSAVVQKEISPYKDSELQNDPALHLLLDTVFLQTLFEGEKPLYLFKDLDEKENFYIKEDSTYSLLLHKIYVAYEPNRKEFHNMRFLGQLYRYFWDDTSLQEEITSTTYTRLSLEKLFKTYLKNQNAKSIYQNEDNKLSTEYSVLAGASVTMVNYENVLVEAGFGPSTNFTGGFSAEMAMSGLLHDFSFYNELMFSSYKLDRYVNSYYFSVDRAIFDFQYLRLNTLIRFQPSWFFINAGISNGYCIKNYSTLFTDVRRYEFGFVYGAGMKYKNYSLEVRLENGDGMSPYIGIYSETKRCLVLLGYSF